MEWRLFVLFLRIVLYLQIAGRLYRQQQLDNADRMMAQALMFFSVTIFAEIVVIAFM